MSIDAENLTALVEAELQRIDDARVVQHLRSLLVHPHVVMRSWDYAEDVEYPCWIVLDHSSLSDTAICYCENGFGPRSPWGLLWMPAPNNDRPLGMGQDSSWYTEFLDAVFESFAVVHLPIWRVFKGGRHGVGEAITPETWKDTWDQVMALRERDPATHYDCDHSILIKDVSR